MVTLRERELLCKKRRCERRTMILYIYEFIQQWESGFNFRIYFIHAYIHVHIHGLIFVTESEYIFVYGYPQTVSKINF